MKVLSLRQRSFKLKAERNYYLREKCYREQHPFSPKYNCEQHINDDHLTNSYTWYISQPIWRNPKECFCRIKYSGLAYLFSRLDNVSHLGETTKHCLLFCLFFWRHRKFLLSTKVCAYYSGICRSLPWGLWKQSWIQIISKEVFGIKQNKTSSWTHRTYCCTLKSFKEKVAPPFQEFTMTPNIDSLRCHSHESCRTNESQNPKCQKDDVMIGFDLTMNSLSG